MNNPITLSLYSSFLKGDIPNNLGVILPTIGRNLMLKIVKILKD